MKNLFIVISITFLLFSCNNEKRLTQGSILENTTIVNNISSKDENELITGIENNEEKYRGVTINDKLNLSIPDVGDRTYQYLFLFDRLEHAKDGYGFDELIERIKSSYLMIDENSLEKLIFDNEGLLNIDNQFYGKVPLYGDGNGFQCFVVIGKFIKKYDTEYYNSMDFSDEIIVTFDNYMSRENTEGREDLKPYSYNLYVYYKKIE